MGFDTSSSSSSAMGFSAPTGPAFHAAQFGGANLLTRGRLGRLAREGTPEVDYQALTPEDLRSLGGAGASRELAAQRSHNQAMDQILSDPSLSVAQRQRATQLSDQDYADALDAIAAETEAALVDSASRERARSYEAELANAGIDRQDLELILQAYYGGKGTFGGDKNESSSSGFGLSLGPGPCRRPGPARVRPPRHRQGPGA